MTPREPGTGHVRASRFGIRPVLSFARDPLRFLQEAKAHHGDLASLRVAGGRWLIVSHPEDVESLLVHHAGDLVRDEYAHIMANVLGQGLLTSDGELWKRQRRLIATAFTPKRIKGYATTMAAVTDRGLARVMDGAEVNLHHEMSRLTMEVVAEVLFGASVGPDDVELVRASMEVLNDYLGRSVEVLLRLPRWVPTPTHRALDHALARIDGLIRRIIDERRRTGEQRDDLLGALLAATDDDGTRMSDAQLRDETVTLFLAGHETTALALTHALYLLAKHPAVEARVVDEVRDVLGERIPTAEDVPRLAYTERVVKESMRLYPPAWTTGREAGVTFELGGRTVEKGTQILAPPWLVHRDPRWWPDPEVFDPDRFLPERAKERPRYAYFPFGGGPRVCVGNHFAMMEAVILLAMIVGRFHTALLPYEELRFSPAVTLRPAGEGLRARFVRRA
jgi:cytochrome P450